MGRVLQHFGVFDRRAPLEKLRTRLGRHTGGVKQVFPTDRHTIKRRPTQFEPRALLCGCRLGHGAIRGQARINAVAVFVCVDRIQKEPGQFDRINLALVDAAPQIGGCHGLPFAHVIIP